MKLSAYIKNEINYIDDELILEAADSRKNNDIPAYIVGTTADTIKNVLSTAACIMLAIGVIIAFILMRHSISKPPSDTTDTDTGTGTNTESVIESESESETATETETKSDDVIVETLQNDEYEYLIINNTITLVRYLGEADDIMLPTEIDGIPVTTVGGFGDTIRFLPDSVKKLTVPGTITTVADYAFYKCESLTSVTLEAGVRAIGNSAFRECASLEAITLPEGLQKIGDYAFSWCDSLQSIDIPDGVTSIGVCAFVDCDGLKVAKIGDGITEIASTTFSNCDNLSSVTLPASVTSIARNAFFKCEELKTIYYLGSDDGWKLIEKASKGNGIIDTTFVSTVPDGGDADNFVEYDPNHDLDSAEFWSDRNNIYTAWLKTDYYYNDYIHKLTSKCASALYPNDGEATLTQLYDAKYYFTGKTPAAPERSYSVTGYFYNVAFGSGEDKTFFTCVVNYNNHSYISGIEECKDGILYDIDYFLDYVNADPRYEELAMLEPEVDDEFDVYNISEIPAIAELLEKYSHPYGTSHRIQIKNTDKNTSSKLVLGLSISDQEIKGDAIYNVYYYYSFTIDLSNMKVSDIIHYDSEDEYNAFMNEDEPNGYDPEQMTYYESDKIVLYRDEDYTYYVKDKSTGDIAIIGQGGPGDSIRLEDFIVIADRYIFYTSIETYYEDAYFIMYDIENNESIDIYARSLLYARNDRVFVQNHTDDQICYFELSEDGSMEMIPVPLLDEAELSWSVSTSASEDGTMLFVVNDNIDGEPLKNNVIIIDIENSKRYDYYFEDINNSNSYYEISLTQDGYLIANSPLFNSQDHLIYVLKIPD